MINELAISGCFAEAQEVNYSNKTKGHGSIDETLNQTIAYNDELA